MARRHKKKRSKFQRLTIVMAWLMALITLVGIIMQAVSSLASMGMLG
ncbi:MULTISPECIES: DUF4044 domain-containing protein [unclassified Lactobacillus]|jgi:hypothetical protein|nr:MULTISPECIES: DUF4044 domain-containing protein [unclassified Lactobacillus]RMC25096.1 DUF4044 domain-containing protein [Lactobacillus sp. ESL0247]RMC29251.1 DUF4044 domain-containing protein [Lactobacillus sp. ESL0246]RMC32271.1 DUF4044 domain-containing protein [Lactobacillus sp. ESL0245]RMC48687.1 DUF4044 domain-containing protein [Lactobacillus sp. ESL0228]